MTALVQDTDYFVKQMHPSNNFIEVMVQTLATVDATNTLAVTLKNYGIGNLIGVIGFKHTTDNSIAVQEQPTTSVTSGVLTITVPAGTDDDPRYYIIIGTPKANP